MDKKVLDELQSIVKKLDITEGPEISEPQGNNLGQICFYSFGAQEEIDKIAWEICELLKQSGYQVRKPEYKQIIFSQNFYNTYSTMKCTITYSN